MTELAAASRSDVSMLTVMATRGDSVSSRLNRRSSTSRIMAKSSPGVSSAERMLNLRYWFFWKPSGPATIMAPTAFVPMMCELS